MLRERERDAIRQDLGKFPLHRGKKYEIKLDTKLSLKEGFEIFKVTLVAKGWIGVLIVKCLLQGNEKYQKVLLHVLKDTTKKDVSWTFRDKILKFRTLFSPFFQNSIQNVANIGFKKVPKPINVKDLS